MQIKKPRSEEAARKDSQQGPMRPDWYPTEIREAVERQSRKGRDMIEVSVVVADGEDEREFRVYLVDASVSWPERSVIVDYAAALAASGVVPLVRVAS